MAGLWQLLSERYQYYAKPEGQDPMGKIMGLQKYGISTAGFLSIYDACLISHCQNAAQFLNTAGYYFVPITGMCLSYSTVTYAMTHLRKKDDVWNCIAGALAAGSVLHAWQKDPLISGWGTFFFVIYVVLRKDYERHRDKSKPRNFILKEHFEHSWLLPWRNMNYRGYVFPTATFKHDREDYYRNFNISSD